MTLTFWKHYFSTPVYFVYSFADIFYVEGLMPCCGKPLSFIRGPRGGNCTNIKCSHCGEKWNIGPYHYIAKI